MDPVNATLSSRAAAQRRENQFHENRYQVEERRAEVARLRRELDEARASNAALVGKLHRRQQVINNLEVAHHQQIKQISICQRLLQLKDEESRYFNEQDGWERFQAAVQCLTEDQIDDGITEVEKMRLQLRWQADRSQKFDCHRSSLRRQYIIGCDRKASNSDARREDQMVNNEESYSNPIGNTRPSQRENAAVTGTPSSLIKRQTHVMRKSMTQPIIALGADVHKQIKPRSSYQRLKNVKSIQNLSAAGVRLGGKVMNFFGKSPQKEKDRAAEVDTIVEENGEDHLEKRMTGTAASVNDTENFPAHQPSQRAFSASHGIITSSYHPNVQGYNLQEAQNSYQTTKMLQAKAPEIQINGIAHASKESQDLELGIMSRLEDEYGENRPVRGTVTSFDYPEGSRERDGAIFRQGPTVTHPTQLARASPPVAFLRRTDQYVFSQSRSQGNGLILMPDLSPRSRLSLPAGKLNRMAKIYGPPTIPPPNKPLPALPRRPMSSPARSTLRRAQNIHDDDDDTLVPASSGTPTPSATAATTPTYPAPAQVAMRRVSAPSPAISTSSNRPWSPSPGGNEPLGDIGELVWMREDAK